MQFLKSSKPIDASVVIGSFGASQGYNDKAFSLSINLDPNVPIASPEKPLRYGKLPEIHHIFRADPKSPPVIISLVFTGAVLATLPVLLEGVSFLSFRSELSLTGFSVALPRSEPQSPLFRI